MKSQHYTDEPQSLIRNSEDKDNNKILESNFAAKRQRQFLRNFLSVEKESKYKNGTHQRLLREGVENDVTPIGKARITVSPLSTDNK